MKEGVQHHAWMHPRMVQPEASGRAARVQVDALVQAWGVSNVPKSAVSKAFVLYGATSPTPTNYTLQASPPPQLQPSPTYALCTRTCSCTAWRGQASSKPGCMETGWWPVTKQVSCRS